MRISVTDAKGRLSDLVRRAEAGDDVVLTRHGHATVRLTPLRPEGDRRERREIIDEFRARCDGRATTGADAAHSQDFLYGDDGLLFVGDDFARTDLERAL